MVIIIFYKIKLPNAPASEEWWQNRKSVAIFSLHFVCEIWKIHAHKRSTNKSQRFDLRFFVWMRAEKLWNKWTAKGWMTIVTKAGALQGRVNRTPVCLLARFHVLDFSRAQNLRSLWRASRNSRMRACLLPFENYRSFNVSLSLFGERVCMFFSLSLISCLIASHLCCVCLTFFIPCIRFRPHLNQLKAKAKKCECVCVR